jgi:predicted DNA-binding antitoxin AbrB/MazE fold protein
MVEPIEEPRRELPKPIDLPDGTEVEIRLPETQSADFRQGDDGPMTPEEIARTLAAMQKMEPLEMSEEEGASLEADRQHRKAWEKAHFDAHAEELRRMWE